MMKNLESSLIKILNLSFSLKHSHIDSIQKMLYYLFDITNRFEALFLIKKFFPIIKEFPEQLPYFISRLYKLDFLDLLTLDKSFKQILFKLPYSSLMCFHDLRKKELPRFRSDISKILGSFDISPVSVIWFLSDIKFSDSAKDISICWPIIEIPRSCVFNNLNFYYGIALKFTAILMDFIFNLKSQIELVSSRQNLSENAMKDVQNTFPYLMALIYFWGAGCCSFSPWNRDIICSHGVASVKCILKRIVPCNFELDNSSVSIVSDYSYQCLFDLFKIWILESIRFESPYLSGTLWYGQDWKRRLDLNIHDSLKLDILSHCRKLMEDLVRQYSTIRILPFGEKVRNLELEFEF